MFDLTPAADQLAVLVRNVSDGDLKAPTPCPEYTVGDLLDHVNGLSVAFTMAALKTPLEGTGSGDAARLPLDFRESIPVRLGELAEAWRSPSSWEGMTAAGGVDLPGEVAAAVALDEIVLHGWDLARATGQDFSVEPELLEVVHGFVSSIGPDDRDGSLFGAAVEVDSNAPLLDRVLGLSGRNPGWHLG
ncbi:TIGR03086 family metal-binding protein [Lentzea sp. BCCO 10_0856]|uniref:TIGR03086 family metal-binding protein n=1 Tax=Lentzea miocenica TaxID=3095431 RepID=A0ABU4T0F9_9PSEU|nr:TIGR03086 family metal-binding protein [Lentzea sp. BCCO 10_0856]MDX8031639.1 TIGR03086 family metal-binding protein [Lentzea sp. BCCO 10_0856]